VADLDQCEVEQRELAEEIAIAGSQVRDPDA
jgi:hypothetical protein